MARSTATNKPCEPPLKEIKALAQKDWITGTPGLVFSDGQLVAGSVNSVQIENYLEEKAKTTPTAKAKSAAVETVKEM